MCPVAQKNMSENLSVQEARARVAKHVKRFWGQSISPGRSGGFLNHLVKCVGTNATLALNIALKVERVGILRNGFLSVDSPA